MRSRHPIVDWPVPRRYRAFAISIAILLGLSLESAQAAPWYLDTYVDAGIGYNDNPEFAESEEIDSGDAPDAQAYGTVGGRMELGTESATSRNALVLAAIARRYQDDETLDSEYLHAGFISGRSGQSTDFSLELGATEDSTLESELTDTGRFDENVARRELYLRPSFERRLSTRTTATLGFGYSKVEFDDNDDELIDYDEFTTDLGFSHQLTERTSGTLDIVWLEYQPEDVTALTDTAVTRDRSLQLLLGAEHRLTQRSRLSWSLGPDFRETEFADERDPDSTDNFVYNVAYAFEDGPNTAGVEVYSTEVSSADGGLELVEGLRVRFARAVSPLTSIGLSVNLERSDPVRGELGVRDYLEVNPWVEWDMSRHLSMRFNLYLREQEFSETPFFPAESSDQNVALLELRYTWDRRQF